MSFSENKHIINNEKEIQISSSPFMCLNMIIKNESAIIIRLLESVIDYIDAYYICDTGSTDNTIDIIVNFFENYPTKKGKIIHNSFKNFGYSRTYSLNECQKEMTPQYILLLDADMIFKSKLSPQDFCKVIIKNQLPDMKTVFYIYQGRDTMSYKNVRIIEADTEISYWGVTHEYVKCKDNTKYISLSHDEAFIADIGDGGSKINKFTRDIKLLKEGLLENPNNDRYTYYLANSLKDNGDNEEAIIYYNKRIEIGGWFQEVWLSYYSMGECYKHIGDTQSAITSWNNGYCFHKGRIENLYKIIHEYRCSEKYHLAYGYYIMADNERKKEMTEDYMFLQKDVYEYKLDYELSIIGYYCNYMNYDLAKISMKVLNIAYLDNAIYENICSNYKFYSPKIIDNNMHAPITLPLSSQLIYLLKLKEINMKLLNNIGKNNKNILQDYVSSTPSIAFYYENNIKYLMVNVRYVNYTINSTGNYDNKKNISSINIVEIFDITEDIWKKDDEFILNYDKTHDGRYIGLEDIRLLELPFNNKEFGSIILYSCNRGIGESGEKIRVEHGAINYYSYHTQDNLLLDSENNIEKNCVLFISSINNQIKCVYSWFPLIIGDIQKNRYNESENEKDIIHKYLNKSSCTAKFIKRHEIKSPSCFKDLRGSTNGILIDNNELWFVCHYVSYEERRYYYHMIVVLDSTSFEVKRHTKFFTFNGEKVEYCLGFLYFEESKEFLFSYSKNDCESNYEWCSREYLGRLFV